MQISMEQAIRWIQILVSLSCVIQAGELWVVRRSFSEQGIWRWSHLQQEFKAWPLAIRSFFDWALSESVFQVILVFQIVFAALLVFNPHPIWILDLFLISVLISVRWRGTFNGGSDYMTILTLMCLFIACLFPNQQIGLAALLYLALQTGLSYLLAGWVKLRNPNWRSGLALQNISTVSKYDVSSVTKKVLKNRFRSKIISWIVILFECSFPLAFLNTHFCLFYLGLAFLFHLGNAFAFGLNRFTWAWLAAYPAVFYCSILISQKSF